MQVWQPISAAFRALTPLDAGGATRLEHVEGLVWAEVHRLATPGEAREHGLFAVGSEHMTAIGASGVDVLFFNRVVGLGVGGYATTAMLDMLVERYRSAGSRRFFIQLSPYALPVPLARRIMERGFVRHNNWAKLTRGMDPLPEPETPFTIEPAGPEHAEAFGTIAAPAFDWPPLAERLLARTVGRPGWWHYVALAGAEVAAVAAWRQHGRDAYLALTVTRPEHRGRGAQSALVARIVRDAAAAGCARLVAETAQDLPDRPSPSFRNLARLGFELAYLRPNYLLDLTAPAPTEIPDPIP